MCAAALCDDNPPMTRTLLLVVVSLIAAACGDVATTGGPPTSLPTATATPTAPGTPTAPPSSSPTPALSPSPAPTGATATPTPPVTATASPSATATPPAPVNHPPDFAPLGPFRVHAGVRLTFRVDARDRDDDRLTLDAPELPAGAAFTAATAVFTWVPEEAQAGEHHATFTADDGAERADLRVAITVDPPEPEDPGGGVDPPPPPPDCGPHARCGNVCCDAGELCFGGACRLPGEACGSSLDCAPEQYCEPFLSRCLDDAVAGACEYVPPPGDFAPRVEWHWDGTGPTVWEAHSNQVMMTPAVCQLTDDNGDGRGDGRDVPDVVFSTFSQRNQATIYHTGGILRAVHGQSGADIFPRAAAPPAWRVEPGHNPACADIDGDGWMEIIVAEQDLPQRTPQGIFALEHDGTLKWHYPTGGNHSGGANIHDLDQDGSAPEIIVGGVVLNADGTERFTIPDLLGSSVMPAVVDLDNDGRLDLVYGGVAYRDDGRVLWDSHTGAGQAAVADFNHDGRPEVVSVGGGRVRLLDDRGEVQWDVPMPTRNAPQCQNGVCPAGGGPPTVADFDGDGDPEIGVAGGSFYVVFETDGDPRWRHVTQDFSSSITGSSVFDFDGDGVAEVVYNDELFLRIYSGPGSDRDADGDGVNDALVLYQEPNPSGTLREYPLIADVDSDGNAEIILPANNYAFAGITGLRVLGDAQDNWVATRRIWNQHAYHVTNVSEDGRVEVPQRANWREPHLNNYRQNVQGEGLFNAPNLVVVSIEVDLSECNDALRLVVRVENRGSRGVPAGVAVALYDATGGGAPARVAVQATQTALLPGGTEEMVFSIEDAAELRDWLVRIDDDGTGAAGGEAGRRAGQHNECDEDDNGRTLLQAGCALTCPPGVTRPAPEQCNGVDDDCDGAVDERLDRACSSACGEGVEACEDGRFLPCSAPEPAAERCDGLDNNCDGRADDGVLNACGRCGALPLDECNGADDDCDRQVDEDAMCPAGSTCLCGICAPPCQRGECGAGLVCRGGFCVAPECR
jgi:outer membrane protein assembly factor BamB